MPSDVIPEVDADAYRHGDIESILDEPTMPLAVRRLLHALRKLFGDVSQDVPILLVRLLSSPIQNAVGEVEFFLAGFFGPLLAVCQNRVGKVLTHLVVQAPRAAF